VSPTKEILNTNGRSAPLQPSELEELEPVSV
jgi:hypothetical protein